MLFMQSERFGALPEGEALQRILRSPHCHNGVFTNLEPAPVLAGGRSFVGNGIRWLLASRERPVPERPLPSRREDLARIDCDCLVWLGHSSFYLQLDGRRLLIDPVFSDYASPLSFINRAFAGTTPYAAEDFPPIDCLLLSHDHWDHLDHASLLALRPGVRHVVCGLGTGAHLRRWGYPEHVLHEADWDESLSPCPPLRITLTTARHFAGRALTKHDRALWCGFVLESAKYRLFFSGDGGYGRHFAEIGRRFGGFDLALLDSGQYNQDWPTVHMFPAQAARAAEELGAAHFLPAHAGRFCLSMHPWDEPFVQAVDEAKTRSYRLLTPVIGEVVPLAKAMPVLPRWWETIS